MSFVPAPQQANAANASSNINNNAAVNSSLATNAATANAEPPTSDLEGLFKMRTFDLHWVEKASLMYKDGLAKV